MNICNNPPLWDAIQITAALQVAAPEGVVAYGAAIDTRKVNKGDIFFGLTGGNCNGGTYCLAAIERGAALCIVDYVPEEARALVGSKIMLVEDAYQALFKMACFARQRMKGKIIGVTGSVGKTSTKTMLYHALEPQGDTFMSQGNFNNHYGLPLSLCQMPAATEFGIFELGMNAPGEIRQLSEILQPDVAMITTVDATHLAAFSSVSRIADAKSEIFEYTQPDGIAILNADNAYFPICKAKAEQYNLKIYDASATQQKSAVYLYKSTLQQDHIEITASCMGKFIDYKLNTTAAHHVFNSLLVLAAVKAAGAEIECAANNLARFKPLQGRGEVTNVANRNIIVIDESYNASPIAVRAALRSAAAYTNKRVIAVLGDMKELGKAEVDMHVGLYEDIVANNVAKVFTVGPLMRQLYEKLPANLRGAHTDTAQQMSDEIKKYAQDNDVVLVKGSLSMQMKQVVDAIIND